LDEIIGFLTSLRKACQTLAYVDKQLSLIQSDIFFINAFRLTAKTFKVLKGYDDE